MNKKFNLQNIDGLKKLSDELGGGLDAVEDVSILAESVKLKNHTIPNSLAIHPMEGCDGNVDGTPGELTIRRYERFASSGAGLVWAEAVAVCPEGRANPRQLMITEENKAAFAEMIKSVRRISSEKFGADFKPIIIAQLTHSGRYSRPEGAPAPIIPQRDHYKDGMTPCAVPDDTVESKIPSNHEIVSDEYLDGLQEKFVKAAELCYEVGFDGVDVKACHGYLLNEILACFGREGKYGGCFENRVRMLVETIEKISKITPANKIVTTRLGIYDATPYPFGWGVDKDDYTKPDLEEPLKLIGVLEKLGVDLVNVTLGNPYYNPHCNRPFDKAYVGGYSEPEHPLAGVARLINLTGEVQKAYPGVVIIGSGYTWLRQFIPNVGAWAKKAGLVKMVGVGRLAFAYPEFACDILEKGELDPKKVCVCCSNCTQMMRDGGMAGCPIRDSKVYGPLFREGRKRNS